MSKQKIMLLSLIALFAVIYGIQLVTSGTNSVKTITVEQEIDAIKVTLADSSNYVLTKKMAETDDESVWIIDNGSLAKSGSADSMKNQLEEIKVVSKISDIANANLYDLQSGKSILVEAMSDGAVVRTIRIGKLTDTMSQTYVEIDNDGSIVLISGDLQSIFDKTIQDIEYSEVVETTEKGV